MNRAVVPDVLPCVIIVGKSLPLAYVPRSLQLVSVILVCCSTLTCLSLPTSISLAYRSLLQLSATYGIKSCRRALSRTASVTLINSLIVTRLDYCNSLLAGCSNHLVDKLQCVLNSAARVIFGGDRRGREHVTPFLRDRLHWLRARERITFKLCLLVYKALNGMAPHYMQDLCVPVSSVSTRVALRSAARGDLVVPRTRLRLGNRAFSVAGSAV